MKNKKKIVGKLKNQPGFDSAYKRLVDNKDISTKDLKFFNISMESFLRYTQQTKEKQKEMIEKLIEMFK
jgi:hypothetical protein